MKFAHIIEARQFDRPFLEEDLFPLVDEMEKIIGIGGSNILFGKRGAVIFYEPSTRTRCSFQMAMDFLGIRVVFSTENAQNFSAAKGEHIEDTARVIAGYHPDVIILRTDKEGMAKLASEYSSVPIINAGDGPGEHPTQAVLDIYTIKKEEGRIDGLSIAMCGDLNRGRTVRSLCYLLGKFSNVKIHFISPEVLQMRNDVKEYLQKQGVSFTEGYDLREVASSVDVIYQTRIQKERGDIALKYEKVEGFYVINQEVLGLMKKDAIIMHPLPRVDEITPDVDKDRRAAYFRQAENGLPVRMALLKLMLT